MVHDIVTDRKKEEESQNWTNFSFVWTKVIFYTNFSAIPAICKDFKNSYEYRNPLFFKYKTCFL